MDSRMILKERIALRYLLAEGPPEHWNDFLKARYQGGKKKVTNTNPKTKDRYKQVTMQTLFNSDEAFKKKVMEEYETWVGNGVGKKKNTSKSNAFNTPSVLGTLEELNLFYAEYGELFDEEFNLSGKKSEVSDASLHTRSIIQHANYDQNAHCGSGCSGNPWDAAWNISPTGWGDNHELGHNLQTNRLNVQCATA